MGFLIKFFLFFTAIYLIIKFLGSLLLGKRNKQNSSTYRNSRSQQTRRKPPRQTETQKDRIIDYQKKTFESTEVEDADFVEIKEK